MTNPVKLPIKIEEDVKKFEQNSTSPMEPRIMLNFIYNNSITYPTLANYLFNETSSINNQTTFISGYFKNNYIFYDQEYYYFTKNSQQILYDDVRNKWSLSIDSSIINTLKSLFTRTEINASPFDYSQLREVIYEEEITN